MKTDWVMLTEKETKHRILVELHEISFVLEEDIHTLIKLKNGTMFKVKEIFEQIAERAGVYSDGVDYSMKPQPPF